MDIPRRVAACIAPSTTEGATMGWCLEREESVLDDLPPFLSLNQ